MFESFKKDDGDGLLNFLSKFFRFLGMLTLFQRIKETYDSIGALIC